MIRIIGLKEKDVTVEEITIEAKQRFISALNKLEKIMGEKLAEQEQQNKVLMAENYRLNSHILKIEELYKKLYKEAVEAIADCDKILQKIENKK